MSTPITPNDLRELDNPVRDAVASLVELLADLPRDRALVVLAAAKLMTAAEPEASRLATLVLRS